MTQLLSDFIEDFKNEILIVSLVNRFGEFDVSPYNVIRSCTWMPERRFKDAAEWQDFWFWLYLLELTKI